MILRKTIVYVSRFSYVAKAGFSYEHIFLKEFLKEGEISPRQASPPNRAS